MAFGGPSVRLPRKTKVWSLCRTQETEECRGSESRETDSGLLVTRLGKE